MAEEKKEQAGNEGVAAASRKEERTGDPGRTPGTAEGDRETVEEDLRDKEGAKEH